MHFSNHQVNFIIIVIVFLYFIPISKLMCCQGLMMKKIEVLAVIKVNLF